MDAFDEVRNMDMSGVADSCNNTNNANNGYHTSNDIQNDYISNNTNINYKDGENATAGDFQSNESVQENQQNTNAADLEYDKETSNSAGQPNTIQEPVKDDEENNDDDVKGKMSNGVSTEDKAEASDDNKEDIDEISEEVGKEIEKKAENVKIDKEDDDDDDEDHVPLAKRATGSANKKNSGNSARATSTQKRGPRGPYNRNRSKLEAATSSEKNQNEDKIDENQCRVCLVKDDLISIFKADNKQTIADKLMTVCSGIRIQRKDFLPQFICNTCMQSVQVAYNLKVLCETTDKDLRSKLSRSKKKMRRPATEYVLLDATKYPSDESDNDHEDNDDEFKLSNAERANTSGSDPTDSGSDYGSRRRSRRVRTKKTQKKKRESKPAAATPKVAPIIIKASPVTKTPAAKPPSKTSSANSASKRNRKESSSPEKRASIDFSSGSEDNYTPPKPKQRKEGKNRSGPGPTAVNAPKEAQCPYCNEMLPSQSALAKHKRTHSNQPLNCDMCGKTFKLLAAYQAHIDKHKSDGDSLKCEKCEKTFTKLVERKRHMIEVHNEKPETFPCEKCKRVFALKKTLERHLEDGKCPGAKPTKPPVAAPQKKGKPDMENLTLGRDLFKCVAPVTTTYWSDSFSD